MLHINCWIFIGHGACQIDFQLKLSTSWFELPSSPARTSSNCLHNLYADFTEKQPRWSGCQAHPASISSLIGSARIRVASGAQKMDFTSCSSQVAVYGSMSSAAVEMVFPRGVKGFLSQFLGSQGSSQIFTVVPSPTRLMIPCLSTSTPCKMLRHA